MAKASQAEALALETLAALLGDPAPKVLHGAKSVAGIFPGATAADKAAARHCLDHGWLAPTGESAGKGKSSKPLYRITPSGLQAVIVLSDPTALLRSLADNLARLQGQVADMLRPLDALPSAVQELKAAVAQALTKIKPVDVDALSKQLADAQATAKPLGPQAVDWGDEVVRLTAEQKQRNPYQRLTLTQVYEKLRGAHPSLTLGQFHDGLRRLQDEKRIRLGPFTQALATLDDPRNALFLDREVKYYVELP
jgi:hypothetical protein